jgi:hypothetical protein
MVARLDILREFAKQCAESAVQNGYATFAHVPAEFLESIYSRRSEK